MHCVSSTSPGQRIAALASSLLVHALLLLALLGGSAVAPLPDDRPLVARLVEDRRGRAAGTPIERAKARAPHSAQLPVAAPRRAPVDARPRSARTVHPSEAVARMTVESRIPPPAIDPPDPRPPTTVGTASPIAAAGPAAGAAGSGSAGTDAIGGMRRIAFAKRVAPLLLAGARRRANGAWAIVAVQVDATGRARDVRMVRSTGSPDLDYALREATRQSRYVPHMRDGKAVMFWGLVPYAFGDVDADIEGALAAAGIGHT